MAENCDVLWKEFINHFGYDETEIEFITEHCHNYQSEMKKLILETADEVSEKTFLFRLPWDMEATNEAVHFESEIDWQYVLHGDEEFIFQLNRHRFFICLGQAYLMTRDEKYAETFVGLFSDWTKKYTHRSKEALPVWRTLEAGLRLSYWARAMSFFINSESITEEIKGRFFAAIRIHADYLVKNHRKGFSIKSNWGVMEYAGLYIASVILMNEEYKSIAKKFLKQALHTQILKNGLQWEASPMYHNEVLAAYLDVIRVTHLYQDKIFDEEELAIIRNMAYATFIHTTPNHHQLLTGDSDDTDVRDLLSFAALLFRDSTLKAVAYEKLDFESAWLFGKKGIEEYDEIEKTYPSGGFLSLLESKEVIFRTSYQEDANFFYFRNASLGGGHGHLDKLHIELWFAGEEILRDSGRYTYKEVNERYSLKSAKAHNVPIVGDKEYINCSDSWEFERLLPSVGISSNVKNGFKYMEGFHLGYMETDGVLVRRRIVMLTEDIILVSDEAIGKKISALSEYYHFSENISVGLEGNTVLGKGKKCRFILKSFDEKGDLLPKFTKSKVSRHYNQIEESDCLIFETRKSAFINTIIIRSDIESEIEIREEEVINDSYGITLEKAIAQGYLIKRGKENFGVILLGSEAGNRQDLNGINGSYGLGQVMAVNFCEKKQYMDVLNW